MKELLASFTIYFQKDRKGFVLFILIVLIWLIWLPVTIATDVWGSQPIRYGPSSDHMETTGVFEPGGYITFTREMSTLNGYYHAEVTITPRISDVLKAKGIEWPAVEKEKNSGWPWGDSMGGGTSRDVSFGVRIDIPDDSKLLNQTIPIVYSAEITYPRMSGIGTFEDYDSSVKEDFTFLLNNTEGESMSIWSRYWNHAPTAFVFPMIMWLLGIVASFIWVLYKGSKLFALSQEKQ